MKELRKHDRIQPQQSIEVFDLHSGKRYGQLVDISAGGLMLVSAEPIAINRIYQLRLVLTDPILEIKELSLGVDSLWSRPNTNHDLFWTGCSLICASEEAEAVLFELTHEHAVTRQMEN